MKKIRIICLFFLVSLLAGIFTPAVMAEPADLSVTGGCHSVDASMQLSDAKDLTETAKAVIVYELGSDTMIYTYNPDQRIYPASMVKLMTALVALEKGDLTEKVAVTKRALSYVAVGSVSAGLVAGEELTLKDLLYCLMTASANDAATVIAEHIGGSQAGFIKMMNERAKELGCKDTNYTNVHGLHEEETYTTARDICRILDFALDNPEFKAMFTAESYTVPATNKHEERIIYTSNYMMSRQTVKKYYDERVTGGKTGSTSQAGRCLAATSKGKGMELLTIVMGAEATYEADGLAVRTFGSFEDTKALLDYVLENFEYRQILFEGQILSQHPVEGGENSVFTKPVETASTVLPVDLDASKLTWIYGDSLGSLKAPIEAGQKISSVQVWYGSLCLAQADLVAANAVRVWSAPVDDRIGSGVTFASVMRVIGWVFLVIVIIAAVVFGILFLPRLLRRFRILRMRRKRRQNRRRMK